MHAGELETSILLAAHPGYVRDGWQTADHSATDRRHLATVGVSAYTDSGVIGYPSRASAEKGRAALNTGRQRVIDSASCRATERRRRDGSGPPPRTYLAWPATARIRRMQPL